MGTSEELSGIDNKVSPSNKPPFKFLLVQHVHFNRSNTRHVLGARV